MITSAAVFTLRPKQVTAIQVKDLDDYRSLQRLNKVARLADGAVSLPRSAESRSQHVVLHYDEGDQLMELYDWLIYDAEESLLHIVDNETFERMFEEKES